METMTETLLRIARRLAAACMAHQTVEAVAVTGSVSAGTADESSDIDLIVLHSAIPVPATLYAIRAGVNGSERLYSSTLSDTTRFKEGYFVSGVRCDLSHITLAALNDDMNLVLEDYSTEAFDQSRLGGIQNCLPLYGDGIIHTLQARVARYPAELRRRMVEKHLKFQPLWVLTEMGVKRGDLLFLYQTLVDAEKNILGILCGLNGVYLPGDFKRVTLLADQLLLAPENLAERLMAVFQLPPNDAVRQIETLIRETFVLVDYQMPEVNTSWPRQWFDLPRTDCRR